MRLIWIAWILTGITLEFISIIFNYHTLSSTWWWMRDSLPFPIAVVLSGIVGGLFLWLMSVHWVFSGIDQTGFDIKEKFVIVLGFIIGLAGACISYRKPRKEKEDK